MSGASPSRRCSTVLSKNRCKSPKCFVHRYTGRKHVKNVWINDHYVCSLHVPRDRGPTPSERKIVFRTHRVTINGPPLLSTDLLHIASAHVEWLVAQK